MKDKSKPEAVQRVYTTELRHNKYFIIQEMCQNEEKLLQSISLH